MVKTLLKTIVAAVLAVTIPLGSPVIAPNPDAGGAYRHSRYVV